MGRRYDPVVQQARQEAAELRLAMARARAAEAEHKRAEREARLDHQLSPGEFEALITNLFSKMGLETKLTQASRDGGVDCVAWDMRPVVGGKV